jgi:hypothetical protein
MWKKNDEPLGGKNFASIIPESGKTAGFCSSAARPAG